MSETAEHEFDTWLWGKNDDKPRFLHAMIRVKDFDASLKFYIEGLGMKVLDRFDVERRRTTGMYIGFGEYKDGGMVELVHPWDDEEVYSHGSGYGHHIAIGVPDVPAMVARLEAMGAEVTLRPQELIDGAPQVAFVKDPDGYSVELIQTRKS
jgi:lactoylglutathione lyase